MASLHLMHWVLWVLEFAEIAETWTETEIQNVQLKQHCHGCVHVLASDVIHLPLQLKLIVNLVASKFTLHVPLEWSHTSIITETTPA